MSESTEGGVAKKAAREALLDAADHLLPGDKVGADWLIYLAITKYGRGGEYDGLVAEPLIQRRATSPAKTRGTQ